MPLVGAMLDLVICADGRAFFLKRDLTPETVAAEVSTASALIDFRRIETGEVTRLEKGGGWFRGGGRGLF